MLRCSHVKKLPASILESLSYFETLLYFYNFFNTIIIPTINENANAVTELQNNFNSLKEWCENYLDTVNFQELTNNKIDSLIQAGLLYIAMNYDSETESLNFVLSEN